MVTDKNVDKKKNIAKNIAKPLTSIPSGPQVRELTQTLIKLREKQLASQEKGQIDKHLQDATVKNLTRSIDLLKNLLQHGYNPGRYVYDEKDFSYSRPVRSFADPQKKTNLDSPAKAREDEAKLAAGTRTDHAPVSLEIGDLPKKRHPGAGSVGKNSQ